MRPSTAKHLASKSTRGLASPSIARRHPRRMGGSPGSTRPPNGECLEKSVPARVVGCDRLGMPVPERISACLTRTSTDGIKHLSSKSMHAPNFLSSGLSPPEHASNFLSSGPSPPERAPPTQSSRLLFARGSARASAEMARHSGGTYCPCTPPAAPTARILRRQYQLVETETKAPLTQARPLFQRNHPAAAIDPHALKPMGRILGPGCPRVCPPLGQSPGKQARASTSLHHPAPIPRRHPSRRRRDLGERRDAPLPCGLTRWSRTPRGPGRERGRESTAPRACGLPPRAPRTSSRAPPPARRGPSAPRTPPPRCSPAGWDR